MKNLVKNQVLAFPGEENASAKRIKYYLAVAFIYIYFLTTIFL